MTTSSAEARPRRWPAVLLAGGVAAAAVTVATAIARFPGVFDDPDAPVWAAVLGLVFVGYAVAAGAAVLRRGSPGRVLGLGFGVVAGVLWLGEIWTQAPARLPAGLERTVPGVCAALAALTTVAAGVVAGRLAGGGAGAVTAGTWAGLTSGAVMTIGLVAIQVGNLDLLGSRPDYQRELAASGGTDMATYLVADAVAGSVSHMVINPGLGLAGAAIGWAICRGLR